MKAPELILQTAPFVRVERDTPTIMREVFLASCAVLAFACWHFGVGALLVTAAATAGAMLAERFFQGANSLGDWSAALTGVLLGLTLPPAFPLWMAFLGGVAGIGLGKLIWGGLGVNLFNPALVGRAFLQAAFPSAITTWSAHGQGFLHLPKSLFALPLMSPAVDAVSTATPLGMAKFSSEITSTQDLVLGQIPGSIGETSVVLLIVIGAWLAIRRTFDWRLPAATLVSVIVFSGILHLIDPEAWPSPLFMLGTGGLLFAAVFMVTDPVTTPTTIKGAWIFGCGVGFLVVLIRLFGGLPEGVMYAILLMNSTVPHIERFTQPKPFGAK